MSKIIGLRALFHLYYNNLLQTIKAKMISIQERLINILTISDQIDRFRFPVLASMAKLTEEVGEFSEEVLIAQGMMPHKQSKEGVVGEAADVIICLLDVVSANRPDLTYEGLLELLADTLGKKSDKWKSVCLKKGQ